MENVRYNISPCSREEVQAFISRINVAVYSPRNTVLADDRSHYDRYSFMRDDSKIAVVYDTTARVISITAPQDYADDLLNVFAPNDKAVKRSTVPAQGTKSTAATDPSPSKAGGSAEGGTRCRVFEKPKEPIRTAPTLIATAKGAEMYSDEICPPQRVIKRARPETGADAGMNNRRNNRSYDYSDEIAPPQIIYRNNDRKNGVEQQGSVRKQQNATQQQPKAARQGAAQQKPYAEKSMPQSTSDVKAGTAQVNRQNAKPTDSPKNQVGVETQAPTRVTRHGVSVHRATISFGDEDYSTRTVRQTPNVRSGTGLYADISSMASDSQAPSQTVEEQPKRGRGRPPKNAPQNTQSSAAETPEDKRLKRRIPTAYEFLPQQARDDLSGGLKNFEQTKLTMTDYSGLLMQPYRGLEAFVLDLQRAEGIRVKMIGQAFDKDENGNYVLKSGYMQKIGSVVYGEVMVALYTEYYSRRNYFAHTDNSEDGSVPRSIPDRAIAKDMFDNLLKVIEYNARKLKEIGFGSKGKAESK